MKAGVILETEGNVQKIQKRALFHFSKVEKGTPNLASPYSLFAIVLIKYIFENNKLLRAVSGNGTQFWSKITSGRSSKIFSSTVVDLCLFFHVM